MASRDGGPSLGAMFGAGRAETFMGLPRWDGGPAPAVLLGADGCTPYPSVGFYCAGGPAAIRAAASAFALAHHNWNFDLGRPAFGARLPADGGDIPVDPSRPEENRRAIRDRVAAVIAQGAVPVLVGGDDSLPIPMLQALDGPLCVLQIDAHIDWRRDVEGERWGLSSTMRRASEMGQVERIVQVGARGIGSARPADVEDARRWGARLVPATDPDPVESALAQIPPGARIAVCLDWDGLDPSIMPAVIGRSAGGLSYADLLDLLTGAAGRGRIVAFAATEFMPSRDIDGQGATLAAQGLIAALGLLCA